ncbi:MAG TPA: 2TM domain-containing protein [Elainellaceae cyanobacterium]
MPESYSQEDVQEILELAIARQVRKGDVLSRGQLFEIADEMGIPVRELEIAEREWLQGEGRDRVEFNRYRRINFRQHVVKYLIVNGFLVLIDLVTFGDGAWALSFSLYIALIWGLFLTLDGWRTYQTEGRAYENAFQRWRRQRWLKRSVGGFLNRWLKPSQTPR